MKILIVIAILLLIAGFILLFLGNAQISEANIDAYFIGKSHYYAVYEKNVGEIQTALELVFLASSLLMLAASDKTF